MADSKIEWTEKVWNPIAGCTKCSPGCLNCYAERMAHRLARMGKYGYDKIVHDDGGWNGLVFPMHDKLDIPLHWRKPCRIFVCSMSDLFHEKVPFDFILSIWRKMCACPQHTFLLLTKRAERMLHFSKWLAALEGELSIPTHLPNVQWGTSISTQPEADKNIHFLLQIQDAAVRWLSIEPMLGPIDIRLQLGLVIAKKEDYGYKLTHLEEKSKPYPYEKSPVDWVVCGGESGPGRRPCKTEWVRSIVDQCKATGVPVFVKQIHKDGKVVKMPKEFPQQLPERR